MTWFRAKKKSYEIWAKLAIPNAMTYNILEQAAYEIPSCKLGDIVILSGTATEQWITSREKFNRTYSVLNGDLTYYFKKVATKPSAGYVFVQQVKTVQQVRTSWGAVLTANDPRSVVPHGYGDFIVASPLPNGTPNLNDMWVVNGTIFKQTYSIEGAPSSGTKACIRPLPSIVCYQNKLVIGEHTLKNSLVEKNFQRGLRYTISNIQTTGDTPYMYGIALTDRNMRTKVNYWECWDCGGRHDNSIWYLGTMSAKALYLGYSEIYDKGALRRYIELILMQFRDCGETYVASNAYAYPDLVINQALDMGYSEPKILVKNEDTLALNDTKRFTEYINKFDKMISKVGD